MCILCCLRCCVGCSIDCVYLNCANGSQPITQNEFTKKLQTGDLVFFSNRDSCWLRMARWSPYSHVGILYKEEDWTGLPKEYQQKLEGLKPGTTIVYEATRASVKEKWSALHENKQGPRIIPLEKKYQEYFADKKGVHMGTRLLWLYDDDRKALKESLETTMEDLKGNTFRLTKCEAFTAMINCARCCFNCCNLCYFEERKDDDHWSSVIAKVFKNAGYLPESYSAQMYMPSDFVEWSSCCCCCCLCWPCPLGMQLSNLRSTELATVCEKTLKVESPVTYHRSSTPSFSSL